MSETVTAPTVKTSRGKSQEIILPPIKKNLIHVRLEGNSILVVHRWSEKAKKEIRDKQQKKARGAKEVRDPEAEFEAAKYKLPNGKDGFPVMSFKKAAVDACSHTDMTKVTARGAFHVNLGQELVELEYEGEPKMREDTVRVGMGTADLRYRPEYTGWAVELEVIYNAQVISAEQIINLFNVAGFAVGVGESRPQKDGQWGMFEVKTSKFDA